VAHKDGKAASQEATSGFAFVHPNRATTPVGIELAQRWALSSPTMEASNREMVFLRLRDPNFHSAIPMW